jgi:hypothetical protein
MSGYAVEVFFKALRSAKTAKRLPEELLYHARRHGWISAKSLSFYLENRTKRRLTLKQRRWRDDIERTVRHRLKVEVAVEKGYAEQRGLLAVPERRSE